MPSWFIGLPVDPAGWFPDRVGTPPAGVQLLHPADLHATVAFLGPCGEAAAMRAWARLEWPLGVTAATLAEVVGMGSSRRPSAFSALLGEGRGEVETAIGACRGALFEAAGAAAETWPAKAHVTLARPTRRARLDVAVAWAGAIDLGSPCVRLDRIALYTRAAPTEPQRYRRVVEAPLAPMA